MKEGSRERLLKERKKKNSLSHFLSSVSFSFLFSLFFLKENHGQPHRRAGRGVQSTSYDHWKRENGRVQSGSLSAEGGWRRAAAPRAMADFRCPVRRRLLASSLRSLPSVLLLFSCGDTRDLDPLCAQTCDSSLAVERSALARVDKCMTRETPPHRCFSTHPSSHLFPTPNRRPLPSSTRTATGPSRPRSWAPSCARWARTRRRRSCR